MIRLAIAANSAQAQSTPHPRGWLELGADLQCVHRAGGYGNAHQVGIVGLNTALTL